MARERIRRLTLLISALAAVSVALCAPATGHAAARDGIASAGVLARGSGYESAGGSDVVRFVQRRLRGLGDTPGPIDGLYGPLTEGAVERFQKRHGLAVDGIVGRQTRRSLFPSDTQRTAAPAGRGKAPGTLARKTPGPQIGSESANEQTRAWSTATDPATRDGPATGIPPEVAALAAALAALGLVVALRRQSGRRLNFGLACAALLAVFGAGAVTGALFATHSAPRGTDEATARSGFLLTRDAARRSAPSARHQHADRAAPTRRRVATTTTQAAAAPAPPAQPPTHAPPVSAVAPAAPAAPVAHAASRQTTYVVKPGDSLSGIASRELSARSTASVAARVKKLTKLNLGHRIQSGDPDLLEAGEKLRLR